eukprot:scaffold21261_cov57-Cyclotella_meneghiniana.AAC.5
MSLSASLQRINNDQQGSDDTNDVSNNGGGGGFLSFLTPWKNNKRKHIDTAEEETTQQNLPRFDNSNINAISNNSSNSMDHSNNEGPSSRKKARPSLAPPARQLTERTSRYQQPSMSSSTARRRYSTGTAIRRNRQLGTRTSIGSSRSIRARRPRIDANFRPMSQYLLNNNSTSSHSVLNSATKFDRDTSLATRILKDAQSKLTHMDLSQTEREETLTFAQERSEAVTRSAPRVRMTRVWGEGQMGGRFTNGPTTPGVANADAGSVQATSQRNVNTVENRLAQPTASSVQASMSASKTPKKKAVTFSTATQQEEYIEVTEAMPSNLKPFKKRKGTPYKKEVDSAITATSVTDDNNGAPFGFMPKDTSLSKTPTSSIAETPKPQNKNDTPSTTTADGWGNLLSQFKPKEASAATTPATVKRKAEIGSGGFSFGATTSIEEKTSDTGSGGFSFATASATEPGSGSGGNGFTFGSVKDNNSTEKKEDTTSTPHLNAGGSGFSFGASGADKLSTGAFPKTPSKSAEKNDATKPFAFGNATSATPSKNEAKGNSVPFGQSTPSSKSNDSAHTSVPSFTFGGTPAVTKPEAAKPESASLAPAFSFGQTAPIPAPNSDEQPAPTFSFGQNAKTPAGQTPGFSFGQTPAPSSAGDSNAKQNMPVPAFGQAPLPAANDDNKSNPPAPAFSFGSAPATDNNKSNPPAPAFSFGSAPAVGDNKSETPAPAFSFGSAPAVGESKSNPTAPPAFSFGQASSSTLAVDNNKSAPPAFSFGSTQAPAPAVNSNPTSFGGTGTPAPAQPSAASFSFGSATNTTAGGFGSATPANTSNQMAFGTNTNNTPVSTGFAPAPTAPMAGFTFGPVPTTQTASFGMPPNTNMSSTTPGGGSFGTTLGPASSFGAGTSSTTPGGFTIGTGDSKKTTGRRIVKARRPK